MAGNGTVTSATLSIPTQESVNAQITEAVRQLKAYVDDARAEFSLGDATINAILDGINGEEISFDTRDRLDYLAATIQMLKDNMESMGYNVGNLTLRDLVNTITNATAGEVFILCPSGKRYTRLQWAAYVEEHNQEPEQGAVVGVVTPYQSFCIAPYFTSAAWGNTTDSVPGLPSSQTGSFVNALQNSLVFQAYEGTKRMLLYYDPEVLGSEFCTRVATKAALEALETGVPYDMMTYIVTSDESFLDANNQPTANVAYVWNSDNGWTRRFVVPRVANNITGSPAAKAAWTYKVNANDTRQWYLPTINHLLIMYVLYQKINQCLTELNLSALPTGGTWSCQQSTAVNASYVTIPSGNVNNNNKSNSYSVVRVSELCELVVKLLEAEQNCFKNKKRKMAAAKYHYHLAQVYILAYKVLTKQYEPESSVCFALTYPKLREVFAAKYRDRVIHHYLAPFIMLVTEAVHARNGNISHGNRPRLSAQTAAEQLQRYMQAMPNGYVLTMDIKGFFMNIARQMSYDIFAQFYKRIRPADYPERQRQEMLALLHQLLINDPAKDCILNSPQELLNQIPPHKSLRYNSGKGLPIGNFYSQLIANLVSAIWGMVVKRVPNVRVTQFVDDMACVVRTPQIANAIRELSAWVLAGLGLDLHPTKFYLQPVRHGAYFCGRVVYKDRLYIGNRSVRACKDKIRRYIKQGATIESARKLMCSVNSYTGIMCHCKSYGIQKRLMLMILDSEFNQYLYFIEKKGHFVCQLFPMYKELNIHNTEIKYLNNQLKVYKNEYKRSINSRSFDLSKTCFYSTRYRHSLRLSADGRYRVF